MKKKGVQVFSPGNVGKGCVDGKYPHKYCAMEESNDPGFSERMNRRNVTM
jgi:hypothetical protein